MSISSLQSRNVCVTAETSSLHCKSKLRNVWGQSTLWKCFGITEPCKQDWMLQIVMHRAGPGWTVFSVKDTSSHQFHAGGRTASSRGNAITHISGHTGNDMQGISRHILGISRHGMYRHMSMTQMECNAANAYEDGTQCCCGGTSWSG